MSYESWATKCRCASLCLTSRRALRSSDHQDVWLYSVRVKNGVAGDIRGLHPTFSRYPTRSPRPCLGLFTSGKTFLRTPKLEDAAPPSASRGIAWRRKRRCRRALVGAVTRPS